MAVRTRSRAGAVLAVALGLLVALTAALLWPRDDAPTRRTQAAPDRPTGFLPVPQSSLHGKAAAEPASLFVSPAGSDAASCSREAPCGGFARAYAVARPGDVVEVAAGRYGTQQLTAVPAKPDGEPVVFRPARGATVTTGMVSFGGPLTSDRGPSGITLRDMTIAGFISQGASRLTLLNVTMQGNFAIQGGARVSVIGGSAGGTSDGSHSEIVAWVDGQGRVEPPRDVLVDGVVFHDVRMSQPSDHVECLQSTDADGLVIRNSRFVRCDTFDLRIDRYRTDGPRRVLIENNVFVHTRDRFGGSVFYGLAVRAGDDVVIRHNSSDIGWAGPELNTAIRGWMVSGNIMPGGRCDDRIVYSHNLWSTGSRCGATDSVGDPRFVDRARGDLRLLAGSPALDRARAADAPRVDHQGRLRKRPDSGAFEGAVRLH